MGSGRIRDVRREWEWEGQRYEIPGVENGRESSSDNTEGSLGSIKSSYRILYFKSEVFHIPYIQILKCSTSLVKAEWGLCKSYYL